jgi:sulfur carrier protein ThiS
MKKRMKFKYSQRKADLLKQLYFTETEYAKAVSKEVAKWAKSLWLEELRKL